METCRDKFEFNDTSTFYFGTARYIQFRPLFNTFLGGELAFMFQNRALTVYSGSRYKNKKQIQNPFTFIDRGTVYVHRTLFLNFTISACVEQLLRNGVEIPESYSKRTALHSINLGYTVSLTTKQLISKSNEFQQLEA